MNLTNTKEEFLSNYRNKQRFIIELGKRLNEEGVATVHAYSDADLRIVTTAMECAATTTTIVIGEDTDLLILLLHYCNEKIEELYMKSEPKNQKGGKMWNIIKLKKTLGNNLCDSILFCHAFLGCDTTSKPFGKGKATALKLLNTNVQFQSLSKVFYLHNCSIEEIDAAGASAMCMVYGGLPSDDLDYLRYTIFQKKVSNVSVARFIKPEELPPTKGSVKYHSKRVYLQVY